MTKDEALKMAIDKWANNFTHERHQNNAETKFWLAQYKMAFNDLFNTCKEALEQPFTRDWKHTIDERIARDSEFKEALEQPTVAELNDEYLRDTYVEGLNQPAQEPVADDELHLAKHAKEYHGLTLNKFKLMCNEADKRYEGQFASSVDKHLAVESFYEGFKIGCTHPHQWQGLTDNQITNIGISCQSLHQVARAIEQALKEKNT
jgi:hypothetical protein